MTKVFFVLITTTFVIFARNDVCFENRFRMTRNKGITNSILDLVGETPLIKLHKITKNLPGNYYAKFEAFNPGHSSKDRIAAR